MTADRLLAPLSGARMTVDVATGEVVLTPEQWAQTSTEIALLGADPAAIEQADPAVAAAFRPERTQRMSVNITLNEYGVLVPGACSCGGDADLTPQEALNVADFVGEHRVELEDRLAADRVKRAWRQIAAFVADGLPAPESTHQYGSGPLTVEFHEYGDFTAWAERADEFATETHPNLGTREFVVLDGLIVRGPWDRVPVSA